jgi:hypothetical protein
VLVPQKALPFWCSCLTVAGAQGSHKIGKAGGTMGLLVAQQLTQAVVQSDEGRALWFGMGLSTAYECQVMVLEEEAGGCVAKGKDFCLHL